MDEKGKNLYESLLPIVPSYQEATSSRPPSSQSHLGPQEISDDAERQGLLPRRSSRSSPTTAAARSRYERPTVESARSSLDDDDFLPSLEGSSRGSTERLRQEVVEQLEIEEPDGSSDNASRHRSLLINRFSKRLNSFTSSFSSLRLPFRKYLPTVNWSWLRWEGVDAGRSVILGRMFGAFLMVSVIYILIASDVLSFGARRDMGQSYDPASIREYVQAHMNENGDVQKYLEHITKYPHMAGTEGNFVLGEWMLELFKAANLEDVSMERFDVYLNYPTKDGRRVAIVDPPEQRWEATIEEPPADHPPREQTYVFHGHSKTGNVTGPLVYANYGSRQDFQTLKDRGIPVEGAIVLVRYYGTQGDRALKIKAAELAGAAGCIIYSDPAEDGFVRGEAWPEGRYRPVDGVQRGGVSLMSWVLGDVLSPGWASTPGERKRVSVEESTGLNKIPSIPISWGDAQHLLQSLQGHGEMLSEPSFDGWIGGVPDVEWWSGDHGSPVVNLMNMQDEEVYQPTYNVLGSITGWEQSEKKIIIGNHRDAWCFGGADPGSGTAIMLEVIRILGQLRQIGWRPLRTIEFASWDGEEYNLIGSTEHVENRQDELRRNGYAYLNVDVGVMGTDFRASASPVFESVLLRVLSRTSDPVANRTFRDIWEESGRGLEGLGAGSDYVAFQDIVGTSSLDMSFRGPPYPYHSCYDNYEWMAKFGDPGFVYHKAMGEIWTLLILELSDRPVLPFDMQAYATAVSRYVADLEAYAQTKEFRPKPFPPGLDEDEDRPMGLNLTLLHQAAQNLKYESDRFHQWFLLWEQMVYGSGGFESNVMSLKRISYNNRMANFETNLLDMEKGGGLPNRTQFKHVIFAPQAWSGYDETFFPGIRDEIEVGDWGSAQQQVNKVAGILTNAAQKLNHN